MSTVLYRKYRARKFSDIRGQEVVTNILTNSIINGQISHAYLFSGPRGTGKTSMARLLAIALNDPDFTKNKDINIKSSVSKAVEIGSYMDLIEIDAASNRGIEEIRQLREGVNYRPSQGKFKVYIIDEVHMLTREAFNALLKTLEEPPSHAVFVLATTEPHKIPDTILSRVQRFDFRVATQDELQNKLQHILESEGFSFDSDIFLTLHTYSGGSFRDSESILGKVLMGKTKGDVISDLDIRSILGLADEEVVSSFINCLKSERFTDALKLVNQITDSGLSLHRFSDQLIHRLRGQITSHLQENSSYSFELKLLKKLIVMVGEFRVIDDTQTLFELMIFELAGNSYSKEQAVEKTHVVSVNQDTGKKSKPISKDSVNLDKSLDTVKVEKKTSESAAKIDKNSQARWKKFMESVKSKDFKIWAHLKVANYSIKDNKLLISTKYRQGFSDMDSLDWMSELVAKNFGDDVSIQITFDSESNSKLSNEQMVESIF